jgi:hypothetical protein
MCKKGLTKIRVPFGRCKLARKKLLTGFTCLRSQDRQAGLKNVGQPFKVAIKNYLKKSASICVQKMIESKLSYYKHKSKIQNLKYIVKCFASSDLHSKSSSASRHTVVLQLLGNCLTAPKELLDNFLTVPKGLLDHCLTKNYFLTTYLPNPKEVL